jgi:predicted nucleotidyltransferase
MFNNIEIKKELKKFNVGIVYLFGSVAQGISTLESDTDLGIVFTDFKVLRNHPQIHADLDVLFSNIYQNREVDIVFLQDAHLTIQLNAINYGRVVYQISPEFRANYEENVMLLYGDFEPLLREFDRMVLERI